METTQPVIFSEEENAREAYLSQQILDPKRKGNLTGLMQKISKSTEYSVVLRKNFVFLFLIVNSSICLLT